MKRPSFQFYPADYLADMRVRMLSWASRGLYVDLLCYCWREGWIPADGSAIAQLCGCHDLAIVEPCLALFSPHDSDPEKLVHKRLIEEKAKQDQHKMERSNSGLKGAKARWKKDLRKADSSANGSANGSAIVLPMAKNGSSTSTSSSKFSKPSMEEVAEYGRTLTPPFTRAADFIDHYESNGWKVGKTGMKDWKASVRTWQRKQPGASSPTHQTRALWD